MATSEQPPGQGRAPDGKTATPPPSFASILGRLKKPEIDESPTDHVSTSYEGKPPVSFSNMDLERGKVYMRFALVMKFSTERPYLSDIRDTINRYWNIPGELTVGALDARHVLVNFETEDAMIKAMARERCNIQGYPYRLARWDSNFEKKKRDSCYKPVWIELPRLPLILFQPKLLKVVAESIGKYLDFTRHLLRPSVAKVCILMDISKPLPEKIWIQAPSLKGYWQQVKYPDPPLYCNHCGLQSHSQQTCWVKHPELKKGE